MAWFIESYLYSEGGASGASYLPDLSTCNTIYVNEGGGNYYARLQSTLRFDDALVAWASELNAAGSLSGVYSITYDGATQRVTIATTNAVTFQAGFITNSHTVLGFQSTLYSTATSHTGQKIPAAKVKIIGRELNPAEHGETVDIRTYRHQRALAIGWGNMSIWRCRVFFSSAEVPAALPREAADRSGYVLTGRVRVSGLNASPYSPINPDGYVDAHIISTSGLETMGDVEEFLSLQMVLGVGA